MWGLQQEHLFLHLSYVSSDFLYPKHVGQENTLPLRNEGWLVFGYQGAVFCSLEEPSTFP